MVYEYPAKSDTESILALLDSPVGLLAWIGEKLYEWTDSYPWKPEELITWTMLYVRTIFRRGFNYSQRS